MALTQAQLDAFEKLKSGLWSKITGQTGEYLLTGEQDLLLALVTISDQLAALTQAITGQPPSVAPAGGINIPTNISLNLPLTAKEINQFIVSTENTRGYITLYASQTYAVVPPAGTAGPGTFSFSYPVPPGYVIATLGPLVVSTTDVGANIATSVTVDGNLVTNGPQGICLGPGVSIHTDQYLVATSTGLSVTATNSGSAPVTVYVLAEVARIARPFYINFYQPLLDFGYQQIKSALGLGV
jgi:hypothetical protein